MKRKWDMSSRETHKKCAEEIIERIKEQEDTEFGMIAAEDIISIVAQNIGPDIYNSAIHDAKKAITNKFADLDVDMSLLEHNE